MVQEGTEHSYPSFNLQLTCFLPGMYTARNLRELALSDRQIPHYDRETIYFILVLYWEEPHFRFNDKVDFIVNEYRSFCYPKTPPRLQEINIILD